MVSSVTGDPDDTELPRLTSDLLLRRSAGSEILIDSSRETPTQRNRAELNGPSPRCVLRITFERTYTLKHVGTLWPTEFTANRASHVGWLFAFIRMSSTHLTPSNWRRHVMRFHRSTVQEDQ